MPTTINGSNANDILTGSDDKDVIDGLTGADQMSGGKNDDVYYVDNAKDVVTEEANEGVDHVLASVSYALSAHVEKLTLTGNALNATGNALQNTLIGNAKNNLIDGGSGADLMIGGDGNDTYVVDDTQDAITETQDGGIDLVKSSVSFTLDAWVENLTLTGSSDLFGGGNDLANIITGNGGNNEISGGGGLDKMIGGKGNDTYYADTSGDKVVELAGQGFDRVIASADFSLAANAANVERLELTGAAVEGIGNALNNEIVGNDNDNYLDGGKGADTLTGGNGADTYEIDNAKDSVVEIVASGDDAVYATVSVTKLWDNVERLYLQGTAALNATGNALDNQIDGNAGKNVLDGGAGADTLHGGNGSDTYIVDDVNDKVQESENQGIDLVKSSVGYELSANVENLTLTGTDNIWAFGNKLNNLLTGNDGSNVLDGGEGKDTLAGGKGDDNYYIDDNADKIVETLSAAQGGGTDSVFSAVSYKMDANVERLFISDKAGNAFGIGNALNNLIQGNDGHNDLDGGKGADTMAGLVGNDTYHVDNVGDLVQELADEGTDTIISTIALEYAVANVEDYTFLTGASVNFASNALDNKILGGSGKDEINGGGGNDDIYGNGGADVLKGGNGNDFIVGGAGADTMDGGSGDDIFYLDNLGDVVVEAANGGDDLIYTSVSLNQLFDGVESVRVHGSAAVNITGNGLDNSIQGNDAKNVIDGGAGKDIITGGGGNDVLTGGSGADTFRFDLDPKDVPNEGKDVIKDFMKAEDILSFQGLLDENQDMTITLDDLLLSISGVVDHGAGKDVDVKFDNGAVITFTGAGTGAVDSIVDLVGTTAQIEVN